LEARNLSGNLDINLCDSRRDSATIHAVNLVTESGTPSGYVSTPRIVNPNHEYLESVHYINTSSQKGKRGQCFFKKLTKEPTRSFSK
jgi:hypothetical protein